MIAARTSRVVVFLFIAFGLAYILGFGFFAAGGALASPKFLLLGIAYMFTPAVAAAVTQRFFARGTVARSRSDRPTLENPFVCVAGAVAPCFRGAGVKRFATRRHAANRVDRALPAARRQIAAGKISPTASATRSLGAGASGCPAAC